MFKKVALLIFAFMFLVCTIFVHASVIYENVSETVLTKGVVHQSVHRFTTNGWYKINTVSVDLSDSFISLKTLSSNKGINTRENVLELAKQSNALAAINADFFQPSGSMPSRAGAIGVVVDDGKMLTTPARGKSMATVAADFDNFVSMGFWDQYITLRAPNDEEKQIYHINKYYDDGALVIFNDAWDAFSPGAPVAPIEMVVEDNIVIDIRVWEDGVKFSENSYVIASTSASDTFLTDNFNIGDKVDISMWFEPNPENYKMAVGGGTMLLINGNDAPVTHNISGAQPRTAMGVDKTGKKVFLVTVDGRQSASGGMTLTELRNYMRDIGCYNAINFDGGGSTAFVSKEPRQQDVTLKNIVSDGSMRKVANGVGVMLSAPVGNAAILDIFTSEKSFYAKSQHTINANVYDEYYRNLNIPLNEIKFEISGASGYFVDNVLYISEPGNATITATYKDISSSIEVYARPPLQQPDTDILRLSEEEEVKGTKIAVLGTTKYTNILGLLYAKRAMSKADDISDVIVFASEASRNIADMATTPIIYGGCYYAAYKQNNIIIQMDNSKGGLLKADAEQWGRFLSLIDTISVKNVIITLSKPPSSFENAHELSLFKQILEEKFVDKGKNVFVIYDDAKDSVKIENGIRYFGLKGIKGIKSTDYTALKQCRYLLITSNGDDVNYQFKSIL